MDLVNVRLGHTRFGAAVQLSKILWAPYGHPGVTSHRFSCAACGCAITTEIKKNRYIYYYHYTFDKGSCEGLYVREEELERRFEEVLGEFQFSEALFEWMREAALRQSQAEKAEFHRCAIEKLKAHYAKLYNRIDQIYLDKLDGEVEEAFYRRNVSQ